MPVVARTMVAVQERLFDPGDHQQEEDTWPMESVISKLGSKMKVFDCERMKDLTVQCM